MWKPLKKFKGKIGQICHQSWTLALGFSVQSCTQNEPFSTAERSERVENFLFKGFYWPKARRKKMYKKSDPIFRCTTPSTWARTQTFYALPKTHKKNLKIRPIVSAPGGVFDCVGWFLQQILKPLLAHVQSHLSSTPNLIDRLGELDQDLLQGKIPISFDVVSLYTNIDTKEALHTVLDYVQSHKPRTYGLATHDLYELLDLLLSNNIFTHGGKFYRQIRGLAMGNRLSGTLAIICMDRFEHTHIYTTYQPYFYGRYVDDIGTSVNNVDDAQLMLTDLNSKHPTIAFELETPNEDKFLPILDLMIRVNKEDQVERKLYCKPASKGITLNFSSHQPSTTKRAMVNAELLRAETYPTS